MRFVVTGGAGGERDESGGGGEPQVSGEDREQLHLQDGHRGLCPQLRHYMLQKPDLQLLQAILPGYYYDYYYSSI